MNIKRTMGTRVTKTVLLGVVLLTGAHVRATEYTWVGASGDSWNTPAKWSPAAVPGAADNALFTNVLGGAMTVQLGGAQAVSNMVFRNRGSTQPYALDTSAQTLTLYGEISHSNSAQLTINSILAGPGTLNVYPGVRKDIGPVDQVNLMNAANSFSGGINVRGGNVYYASDGALGAAANTITVGVAGAYGRISTPNGPGNSARNYTLSGNGAMIQAAQTTLYTNSGVITGSGELIVRGSSMLVFSSTNASDYSGGTRVWQGMPGFGAHWWPSALTLFSTAQVLGTGDLRLEFGGNAVLGTVSNLAAAAKVHVGRHLRGMNTLDATGIRSTLFMASDSVPAFTTNSAGAFGFEGTSGANVKARLAYGQPPLGDGTMWLCSRVGATFTGSTLIPGSDHVFRFQMGGGNVTLDVPSSSAGALQDYGGFTNSLEVVGNVALYLRDANTFSGGITLDGLRATSTMGYVIPYFQPAGQGSALGSTNADVTLMGNGQLLAIAEAANRQPISKRNITFDGTATIAVDQGNIANTTGRVDMVQLVRAGNSTIVISGSRGFLGASGSQSEQVFAQNAPLSSNGMVSPAYIGGGSAVYDFLNHGANGFVSVSSSYYAATDQTTFDNALSTSIVNLTAAVANGSPKTIYALRTTSAVTGGGTLTITSGGLINKSAVTHTVPLSFATEPVIYAFGNTVLNGSITSTSGLTKSGTARLDLGADNSATLTGTITVNLGALRVTAENQLGAATNMIVLNGGDLDLNYNTTTFGHPITLGANGGGIGLASVANTLTNRITGVGVLRINATSSDVKLAAANNDYTGGTYVGYSGNAKLTLLNGATCGSGPVAIGVGNNNPVLVTQGTGNLTGSQAVGIFGAAATWQIECNGTQTVSSLEGYGNVKLNDPSDGFDSTLSVGSQNTDFEFAGSILDRTTAASRGGRLIKTGTGTFTLSGYNMYGSETRVENGTLLVNGTIDNASTVTVVSVSGSAPVLGGKGVVRSLVKVAGGSLVAGPSTGSLKVGGLVLDSASTLRVEIMGSGFGHVEVNGPVVLGDATLIPVLGVKPVAGQSWMILNNTTGVAISGQWAGGSTVTASYEGIPYVFKVDYRGGDGNDVVLTYHPAGTCLMVR